MKKSISVNISGLLFNIEEDAYEQLKHYLDEIKLYFSGYEASGEIVADIENRIAEIFSTKVGPQKQVLTESDVQALIAQMGNIRDFAAIEEPYEEPKSTNGHTHANSETWTDTTRPRRLYRSVNRKIIGGVAAGIADYLRIDPLWVRLVMAIIMFDIFLSFSFSGALLIGYIILWIALPTSTDEPLKEEKKTKTKKMFRHPDDRVIAGVCGGLGAYFGVDAVLIRVLLAVLFVFAGSGLFLYILLWVIMPKARTLTERMQMQGEPVTLANIEHQVKKNLNLEEGAEEGLLARILLFPFRLISSVFSGESPNGRAIVTFVADAIRVVLGLILSFGGFMALLALLVSATVVIGFYPETYLSVFDLEIPHAMIRNTIPDALLVAALLLAAVPALYVMLLGIAMVAGRWVVHRSVGWGLAGVWIIALICVAIMAPRIIANYSQDNYYQTEAVFNTDSTKTLQLKIEKGNWQEFRNVTLTVKGSPDKAVRLEQRIWGRGATTEQAREHAQLASYPVRQQGNTLFFKDQLELPEDKPFYGQTAKATLYIPYGQRFVMQNRMDNILTATMSPWGFRNSDMHNNTFMFNRQGELECLTCPAERQQEARNKKEVVFTGGDRVLDFKDFDKIKIGNNYQLTLIQGPDYKVEVKGDDKVLDEMKVRQQGSTLSFFTDDSDGWWKSLKGKRRAHIFVSVPNLAGLYLSGASSANIKLEQGKPLALELSGASEVEGDVVVENLELEMSGSSEATLSGNCTTLTAELSGASELNAATFRSTHANVDLSGASDANIWVTDQLKADLSGGSNLDYKGKPANTNIDKSTGADVSRRDD
ncbi:PspC domain-containing protein [Cesiribacter sp. SM1]|uniref:PspC domain-containing protein n=1 Tax=Cesiribacter sp. SM1 TaxID=2861196 RepID=UPI001CD48990|nr:PspC domain-containing protein [Cesiribacter sp. SM1]